MSLARVKTWSAGEILTAAELNAEFNNILNNPINLISPVTATVDMDGNVLQDALYQHAVQTISDGDTTPPVSGGTIFQTANTAPTTIAMFDSAVAGQVIWVLINDANTTIDFTGTNLKGNVGADWTPTTGDTLMAVFISPNWYCWVSDNTA